MDDQFQKRKLKYFFINTFSRTFIEFSRLQQAGAYDYVGMD